MSAPKVYFEFYSNYPEDKDDPYGLFKSNVKYIVDLGMELIPSIGDLILIDESMVSLVDESHRERLDEYKSHFSYSAWRVFNRWIEHGEITIEVSNNDT